MPVLRGTDTVFCLCFLLGAQRGGKWELRVGGRRENIDQDGRGRADREVRTPRLTPTSSPRPWFLNLSRLQKNRN